MSAKIDIRPDHLEIVQNILRDELPAHVKVWVFGSRAKWSAKDYSDLDLALETKDGEKLSRKIMRDLEYAFEESDLPWKVDLLDINTITPKFKAIIEKDKVAFPLKTGGGGMSEWKTKKISDIAKVIGGGTPPTKNNEYYGGNIPWLTPKDLSGYNYKRISRGSRNITEIGLSKSSAKILPKNSVLLTSRAPIGYVAISDCEVSTNQGFKSLVLHDNQDPDFYYYLLKHNVPLLESRASGSTFKEISGQVLKNTEFLVPRFSEQKKISQILSSLDDKIENNRKINETLEGMAQAVFKSWFVDFEPTKAKIAVLEAGGSAQDATLAAMTAISGKSAAELEQMHKTSPEAYKALKSTATFFPASMQNSELGQIPESWEVLTIGDIVERLKPSKRYTKKQVELYGNVPVYEQGADILLGHHNDDAGFIASKKDPLFIFGDHTCITYLSCKPFDISQNVIPLKGKNFPTMWVYYAIQGKQMFQEYRRHWSEFIIKDIVIPSPALAKCFTNIVTKFYETKEDNIEQSQTLTQTRDALLPKLLSGEIDVSDVAHKIKETAS